MSTSTIGRLLLISTLLLVTIWPAFPAAVAAGAPADEKMKPEEVVAKHLESIGTPGARAAVRSRVVAGTSLATFRVRGVNQAQGRVVLASEGARNMVAMKFDAND